MRIHLLVKKIPFLLYAAMLFGCTILIVSRWMSIHPVTAQAENSQPGHDSGKSLADVKTIYIPLVSNQNPSALNPTPSSTPTRTPTATPTHTSLPSIPATSTHTPTPTGTPNPASTSTPTPTPTRTPTATSTLTQAIRRLQPQPARRPRPRPARQRPVRRRGSIRGFFCRLDPDWWMWYLTRLCAPATTGCICSP